MKPFEPGIMMPATGLPFRSLSLAVALGFVLVACGKGTGTGEHAAGQVAAKVNGDEISVHQIDDVVQHLPGVTEANAGTARREVLGKLVDQQLAVQQAIDKKLDRTPEVVTAIENARREILARAYLAQAAGGEPPPTADETKKYYGDHPELFSDRRIYRLQEIDIPLQGVSVDRAKLRELATGKSPEQFADWLRQQNIKFTANAVDRPAEQIPLALVAQLHGLKDGQTIELDQPGGVVVLHLVTARPAPVDEAAALPKIQQFLANERGQKKIAAAMQELRAKARIEYLGEYAAGATPSSGAAAQPPASPSAPAAAADKAGISQTAVDKGVAGLK